MARDLWKFHRIFPTYCHCSDPNVIKLSTRLLQRCLFLFLGSQINFLRIKSSPHSGNPMQSGGVRFTENHATYSQIRAHHQPDNNDYEPMECLLSAETLPKPFHYRIHKTKHISCQPLHSVLCLHPGSLSAVFPLVVVVALGYTFTVWEKQ